MQKIQLLKLRVWGAEQNRINSNLFKEQVGDQQNLSLARVVGGMVTATPAEWQGPLPSTCGWWPMVPPLGQFIRKS